MTPKRTYINLINDFWEADAQKPFSAPVTRVYFYLLNRINRNRWEPVFISDVELAEASGASRRHLPEYREELTARGLLSFQKTGTGRQAGTFYTVPETAPKVTVNCAERNSLEPGNCAQSNSKKQETAPKVTVNCAERNSLEPSTPINVYNKTSIRPSTTTEDMRANAPALTRDVAAVEVEAEEVEILGDKKTTQITGAADELERRKKRARDQGKEILKSFFAPSNQYPLECLCKNSHVTPEQLRQIAERIIAEWTQDGKTHDDYKGRFDISDAIRHLRMTIPKKATAEARGQAMPKTREQSRQDLMAGALQNLRNALNRDGQPAAPADADPF